MEDPERPGSNDPYCNKAPPAQPQDSELLDHLWSAERVWDWDRLVIIHISLPAPNSNLNQMSVKEDEPKCPLAFSCGMSVLWWWNFFLTFKKKKYPGRS
jgi:hypothetical protein